MHSKKGMEPLIATFILLFICLALAAGLMFFLKDYEHKLAYQVDEYGGRLRCSADVDIDIIKACIEDQRIVLAIQNQRGTALRNDNFFVRVYQEQEIVLQPVALSNLGSGEIKNVQARYDAVKGVVSGVSLIPVLETQRSEILCMDNEKIVAPQPCSQ